MSTDTLGSILAKAEEATKAFLRLITAGRERIEAKYESRHEIATARATEAEIEQRARVAVAANGRYWLRENGHELLHAPAKYTSLCMSKVTPPSVVYLPHGMDQSWGLTCAAEPERAVSMLMALVRQLPQEAGLPARDRVAVLERLDREIAELEADDERMTDEANSKGLGVPYRAEVVERRAQAAKQQRADDERAAARAARESRLEHAYAETVRRQTASGSPSPSN